MRGKTRGLLEDIAILGLCGLCLYGGYNLFFGSEDRSVSANKPTNKVITTKQVIVTSTPKQQDSNNTIASKTSKDNSSLDKNINTSKYTKQHNKTNTKQANKQISKPKQQIAKQQITKTTKEKQTKKKKNVNLRSLYIFLANTKQKVYDSIDWSKANKDIQDNFLKIRVTILKDGNYEQLTFVDGDKELFEASKQNITKIFPLVIKDDIKDDFPRYFRMKFDINPNSNSNAK